MELVRSAASDSAPYDLAMTVSLATRVIEGVLWILMCAAWAGYHLWLRRRHGVAHKSTRPVSLFLTAEAVSKGLVLVTFFFSTSMALFGFLQLAAFVCTRFSFLFDVSFIFQVWHWRRFSAPLALA